MSASVSNQSPTREAPRKSALHVLLCTGSRALQGSEFHETARGLLIARMRMLPPNSLLVFGDCDTGPDEWALTIAKESNQQAAASALRWRMFSTDGWVYDEHMSRTKAWCAAEKLSGMTFKQKALARNEQMAIVCAGLKATQTNAIVEAIALEAAWSKTKGTAHTATCALERGIQTLWMKFCRPSADVGDIAEDD